MVVTAVWAALAVARFAGAAGLGSPAATARAGAGLGQPEGAAARTAGLAAGPPQIKVWLSDERVVRGDRVRVYVRVERDGYVVVLHAEPSGRIRVLYPVDPTDDDYVRGGRTYEVRGRGDRDAVTVYEAGGTGTVLAAFSLDPFRFEPFVRQDHWDYRVEGFRAGDDPESDLLGLARRMAGSAAVDYDVVRYDVRERVAYRERADWDWSPYWHAGSWWGWHPWRSSLFVGVTLGRPWCWGCDPWFCDPWCDPFFYRPVAYWPSSYWIAPVWWDPWWWYRPYPRTTVILTFRSVVVRNRWYGPHWWSGVTWRAPQRYGFSFVQPGRRVLGFSPAGAQPVAGPARVVASPAQPAVRLEPAVVRRAFEPRREVPRPEVRGVRRPEMRAVPRTPSSGSRASWSPGWGRSLPRWAPVPGGRGGMSPLGRGGAVPRRR